MNEHSDPGHDFDFELDQVLHALMETVPEAHRPRYAEIGELIDVFCDEHLQPLALDYQLCCRALAAACCQRSSPVVTRRVRGETWAAAIVYTIAWVNLLSNRASEPVMSAADLAQAFGLSESTLYRWSREIREGLEIFRMDPAWTLPSLAHENPLIWLVETEDGVVVDIRQLPREDQVSAYRDGLIPFVPADVYDDADAEYHGDSVIGYIAPPDDDGP